MQGDLNDVQVLALLTVMTDETEREHELELTRFKMTAIAMHPERAEQIMAIGDPDVEQPLQPVRDEDLAGYVPIQDRPEVGDLLADLKNLGFAMRD